MKHLVTEDILHCCNETQKIRPPVSPAPGENGGNYGLFTKRHFPHLPPFFPPSKKLLFACTRRHLVALRCRDFGEHGPLKGGSQCGWMTAKTLKIEVLQTKTKNAKNSYWMAGEQSGTEENAHEIAGHYRFLPEIHW